MDFSKIKLIIWDLDETLWKGTLSEESVVLPDEHKNLIIKLTDIGIVNSICSKMMRHGLILNLKNME